MESLQEDIEGPPQIANTAHSSPWQTPQVVRNLLDGGFAGRAQVEAKTMALPQQTPGESRQRAATEMLQHTPGANRQRAATEVPQQSPGANHHCAATEEPQQSPGESR